MNYKITQDRVSVEASEMILLGEIRHDFFEITVPDSTVEHKPIKLILSEEDFIDLCSVLGKMSDTLYKEEE